MLESIINLVLLFVSIVLPFIVVIFWSIMFPYFVKGVYQLVTGKWIEDTGGRWYYVTTNYYDTREQVKGKVKV